MASRQSTSSVQPVKGNFGSGVALAIRHRGGEQQRTLPNDFSFASRRQSHQVGGGGGISISRLQDINMSQRNIGQKTERNTIERKYDSSGPKQKYNSKSESKPAFRGAEAATNITLPKIKLKKNPQGDKGTWQPINKLSYFDGKKVDNERLSIMGSIKTPAPKKLLTDLSMSQLSAKPDPSRNRELSNQVSMPSLMTEGNYSTVTNKRNKVLLPFLETKLIKDDLRMQILQEKYQKIQRKRQLYEWATMDYGIKLTKAQANMDEAQFIFTVKQKYIAKRNEEAALKIQSRFRSYLCRKSYIQMRNYVIGVISNFQAFYRMRTTQKKFRTMVKIWKNGAALTVQKYLRGKLGRNKFMSYKRYNLVDDLAGQVQEMVDRCGLDLKVKLWYQYNQYKKRKAEEKRKKKVAAEKAKNSKKKGSKYGGGGYKAPAKPAANVNLGKAATQMAGQVATKIAADINKVAPNTQTTKAAESFTQPPAAPAGADVAAQSGVQPSQMMEENLSMNASMSPDRKLDQSKLSIPVGGESIADTSINDRAPADEDGDDIERDPNQAMEDEEQQPPDQQQEGADGEEQAKQEPEQPLGDGYEVQVIKTEAGPDEKSEDDNIININIQAPDDEDKGVALPEQSEAVILTSNGDTTFNNEVNDRLAQSTINKEQLAEQLDQGHEEAAVQEAQEPEAPAEEVPEVPEEAKDEK